jgi:hypothetical protein
MSQRIGIAVRPPALAGSALAALRVARPLTRAGFLGAVGMMMGWAALVTVMILLDGIDAVIGGGWLGRPR